MLLSLFLAALVVEPVTFIGVGGHGAIVIRDYAPVYQSSEGEATVTTLMRENAVTAFNCGAIFGSFADLHSFKEADGRLRVAYLAGSPRGTRRFGWMDPRDLSQFSYAGSCAVGAGPFSEDYFDNPLGHGPPQRWNACFEAARDAKLAALRTASPF
jgi:hypothetical protein